MVAIMDLEEVRYPCFEKKVDVKPGEGLNRGQKMVQSMDGDKGNAFG